MNCSKSGEWTHDGLMPFLLAQGLWDIDLDLRKKSTKQAPAASKEGCRSRQSLLDMLHGDLTGNKAPVSAQATWQVRPRAPSSAPSGAPLHLPDQVLRLDSS